METAATRRRRRGGETPATRKNRRALPGLEAAPKGIQECPGVMGPSSARSSTGTLDISESSDQIQTTEQSEESHDTEDIIVLDEESSAEKWILNKKLRSKVWKEFDLKVVEGSVKAICMHCSNEFVAGNRMGGNSSQHKRSDLEVYLDDPSHPEMDNFDIIAWWKLHGPKYPIISLMARDSLSVPVSTVASESAFSLAGLILDEHRCSLLPKTVEALICTQDWLRDAIPVEPRITIEDTFAADSQPPTINPHPSFSSAEEGL